MRSPNRCLDPRAVWPFILAPIIALVFVGHPPGLTLWLPSLVLPVK